MVLNQEQIATAHVAPAVTSTVHPTSVRLVGRREELDRIGQVARADREGALLVLGEAGTGKTSLLEAAQAESAIRAVLVHTMSAEAAWPMSGFSRVFAFVSDVSSVDFFGRFGHSAPDRSDTFEAARELLTALRGRSPEPVLLLVDDIDRMDSESQVLLSFIAEGLVGTGIRLVATASHVDVTSPLASFRRMDLQPLSAEHSRALSAFAAGPTSDAGTARIIADDSAGNPLAIVETTHLLSPAQIQGREPLVLPFRPGNTQREFAGQLLAELSPPQRTMLESISLAPSSNTSALAAGDSGEGDTLEDLVYSNLVVMHGHGVQVRDPRLRAHLYWNLEPRTRREIHRAMAEAHRGIDERTARWHTSFIDPGPKNSAALLQDATEFAAEGNTAAAIEFAERAIRVAGSVDQHLAGMIDLATAFLEQSELDLASRYALQGRHVSTSAELSMKLTAILVTIEYTRTHIVPTNDIDATLSIYASQDPVGALQLLTIAATCHSERWEVDEARRYLVRADQLMGPELHAYRGMLDAVRLLVDAVDGAPGQSAAALDDLDSRVVSNMSVRELIVLGKTLTFREQYARARHVLTIVLNQPQDAKPLWVEVARYLLAVNEIRSGNFHRARAAVEEWMSIALPSVRRLSSRLLLNAWYLNSTGHGAEAKVLYDDCMEQTLRERNPAVAAQVLALQGGSALAEGDYTEAARLLELAEVIGQRFANPALLRSSIDLIEAYAATKRLREARSVLEVLESQQEEFPSRWLALALARGRGLTVPDDECLMRFRQALDLFEPRDSEFELGRTLTNYASAQARLGFGRESEKSLAAARSAFGNAGAQSWALRANKARTTPDTDVVTALGVLTEEEQLIVEKVREGYRNKEIAAALYISLRTVELRLTHIYRKVGARSRSHLAALLN